jgi:hypothetical protein
MLAGSLQNLKVQESTMSQIRSPLISQGTCEESWTPPNSCLWMWAQRPNAEYIMQTCPIMTSREPTTRKTKLWGTADDPQDQAMGHSGWPARPRYGAQWTTRKSKLWGTADDPQDQAMGHSGRPARPSYGEQRTTHKTKLWGTADNLWRTANFVERHGRWSW